LSDAEQLFDCPDWETKGRDCDLDRLFPFLLLAITFAALVPALVLGASEFISYDGYWHVFMDMQNRWKLFLFEYRRDAHPVLYHLVLRVITLFGHSRLAYRSASIIPGVVSVYLLGRIAGKLCSNKGVALLAAAAYGFSMVMIGIIIDVRSYPLALVFVIAAFYYLVDFLAQTYDASANRSLVLFGIFTSLAIASEYYAIFFLVACLGVLALLWTTHSAFRERSTKWAIQNWHAPLIAFGLPLIVTAYFYLTHVKYLFEQRFPYRPAAYFFWTPASSRIDFILRNLRADLNYMLPVEIPSTPILFVVLVVFVPLLLYFGLFRKQSRESPAVGVPGLVLLLLLAELIVLSQLQWYPFGGNDRQQSIFFPFFILTAFILLDRLIAYLPGPWLKTGILGAIAVLIAVNFSYRWQKTPRRSVELFTKEYRTFQAKVAPAAAVYVDQFTLIAYYIHTHDWKWKFHRHLRAPDHIDEYDLTSSTGQHLALLRNIDHWNFDLNKPATYQILARSLHDAHLASANMFMVKFGHGHADPSAIAAGENRIRKLAADAGLRVTSLYSDNTQAAITFNVASL
jgi:uncharacterized membrane protein